MPSHPCEGEKQRVYPAFGLDQQEKGDGVDRGNTVRYVRVSHVLGYLLVTQPTI